MKVAGSRQVLALAATACLGACEPTVVIGQWTCPPKLTDAGTADAGTRPSASDPISMPWSTGFEDRFCDYELPAGLCFGTGSASYRIVTSPPPHGGRFAAAFTAFGGDEGGVAQVRCYRQGVLPKEAYYGAWYYIPATASNSGVWNLFHFQGAAGPGSPAHGTWDVSLVNGPNGQLKVVVFDFLWRGAPGGNVATALPPAPIGKWFHLQLYLKRAKDATGEVALYQDGTRVAGFKNLVTDDTDWAQWFVGNYVTNLNPPDSTLYVDDVTIAASLD